MSARDDALAALETLLSTALTAIEVTRDETRTRNPPAAGLVLLREGELREALPILSPLAFQVVHDAELIVLVPQSSTVAAARATLDEILVDIVAALAADRSVGGTVEWADAGTPRFLAQEDEGAGAMMAALMPVGLHFTAADSPAGDRVG